MKCRVKKLIVKIAEIKWIDALVVKNSEIGGNFNEKMYSLHFINNYNCIAVQL